MKRILALLIVVTSLGLLLYSSSSPVLNVPSAPGADAQLATPNAQPSSTNVFVLNSPLLSFQDQNGGEMKMTLGTDYDSFCFGADMFEQIRLSPEEKRLVNLIKGANDINLAVAGDLHSVTLKPGQTGYYGVRILPPKRGEVTGVTFVLTTVPISGVPDIVNNYFKIKYVESVGGSAGNVKDGTTSGKAYQVISPAGDIWFFFAFTAVVKSGGIRTTIEPHFFGGPHIASVEPQYIQCCCEHVKTPLIKVPEPTICWWYGIPYISDLYVWWYKYALYCKAVKNTQNVACTHGEATGKDLVIKGDGFNRLRGRETDLPTLITITDDCGSVARVTEATIVSDNEIRAKIDITVCRPGQKCVKISGVGGFGTVTFLKVVQDVPDTIVTQKRFTAVRIFGTQEKLSLTFMIDNGENIVFPQDQRFNVTCVTRSSGTTATATSTGTCNNIATTTIQGACVPGEDNITVTGPGINCVAPIRNADITLVAVPNGKSAYVCVGELQEIKVTVKSPSTYYSSVTLTSSSADVIRVWADPAKTTAIPFGEPIFDNPVPTSAGSMDAERTLWVEGLKPGMACLIATYCDKSGAKSATVAFTTMSFLTLRAEEKAHPANVKEDTVDGGPNPVIVVCEASDGSAKVILKATTNPATGDVLQRVKYTVGGATSDPSAGAFDPTKPTEVTLMPTGGNRTYTITAWLDCDNDGNRDPEETTRAIEATVVRVDTLTVTESANTDNKKTDATTGGPDPVLYICDVPGGVKVKLSATSLPADVDRSRLLWKIAGNAPSKASGDFATDPEVTLVPADDASRIFTVTVWYDCDNDKTLDPDEITRSVTVMVPDAELTVPAYIGVWADGDPTSYLADATLRIVGGSVVGKWRLTYNQTMMEVYANNVLIPSGQLSAAVTLPVSVPLKIKALKAGRENIEVRFFALEGEGVVQDICHDAKSTDLVDLDVDVDSDNNNYTERTAPFQGPPDRSEGDNSEEAIEDNERFPGKVMGVNDNDDDHDGVRDDVDGFNRDSIIGGENRHDDINTSERDFVPVVLEIPAPVDLAVARINITTTAAEKMRLWTKRGDEARNIKSVKSGGDWVEPGVYERAADLARLGFTADNREVTLYVEGLGPSTGRGAERILVALDPDGAGESFEYIKRDAVRLTLMRPDADVDTDRDGGTDNDDDTDEYTRGYYTWKGDLGGRLRPFDTNIEPAPSVLAGGISPPFYGELEMTEAPPGGEITIIGVNPATGLPENTVFRSVVDKLRKGGEWGTWGWAFWPGDYTASPATNAIPGIYRFRFTFVVQGGFSIADEVTIRVLAVDIAGHRRGTFAIPGAVVSETDEGNPLNLIVSVNNDNDEGGPSGQMDNRDTVISPLDDDIARITLKRIIPPDVTEGTLRLTVTGGAAIHVFKPDGSGLLADYSVNLALPVGDLAGLREGDVNVYVEGIAQNEDVVLTLTYHDIHGVVGPSDSVHLTVRGNVVEIVKLFDRDNRYNEILNPSQRTPSRLFIAVDGDDVVHPTMSGVFNPAAQNTYNRWEVRYYDRVVNTGIAIGQEVRVPFTPIGENLTYTLIVGNDLDGSGTLDPSEIITNKIRDDTEPIFITAFTKRDYDFSTTVLIDLASSWDHDVILGREFAALLLFTFLDRVDLYSGDIVPTSFGEREVTASDYRLTHKVGATFGAGNNVIEYIFADGSVPSDKVENSLGLKEAIDGLLSANRQVIIDYFASNPSDTRHQWEFNVNKEIVFESVSDLDLSFAIHKGILLGTITVTFVKTDSGDLAVEVLHVDAHVTDLYDFDYESGEVFRSGAVLQVGWDQDLGRRAGHIFLVNVELLHSYSTWDFRIQ